MAQKNKKRRILPALLAAAALVLLSLQLIHLGEEVSGAQNRMSQLQTEVDNLTAANQQLSDEIQAADDIDMIKEIARDELGLVEPGEKVFRDVNY